MSVVNLGIKDFRDFEFRLVIDNDWQGWGLNTIGIQIWSCWFQHWYVEDQVYSMETVWKSESDWNGCQEVQGFHMVQGIYQIVSWKVVSYGRIEPWHKHGFQSWIPEPVAIGNQWKFGIDIEHWQCVVQVVGVAHQGLWQSHECMQMQGCAPDELWGLDDNPCAKKV